jgi:outer membrane autotransporter protein
MSKFKALAAVASFIAIILPLSSGAATELTTVGTPATVGVNNGLVGFVNGDSVKLGGAHNLLSSGNHIIAAMDISGNNSIFTMLHDISLGSVGNSGLAGKFLTVLYSGLQTITLPGTAGSGGSSIGLNDYSGLGLVDYNNNAGILELNSAGVNYANNFQSTGGDNGTIRILQNSTLSGAFSGTAGTKVASLVLTTDRSLVLNTNLNLSANISLESNTTFIINSGFSVSANKVEFVGGKAASMIFGHNTTLDAEVGIINPGGNIIEFQGASNILKKIDIFSFGGNGSKVIFSSNNPAHRSSLTNNISADVIETKGSKIGIDAEEIALSGQTTANNTIFDLGLNTALFTRGFAVIMGTPKFNSTFNGVKGGHLAAEGINIDMSGADTVTINLTDISSVPGPAGRQYTIFAELRDKFDGEGTAEGSMTLPDDSIVALNSPANPLVKWTYSEGILSQVLVPNVDQVVAVLVPNHPNVTPVLSSSAREDLLNVVNQSGNAVQLLDALQPDAIALGSEPANQAAESASQMISGATRVIDARISNIQVTDSGLSGVTAGDTNNQIHGLWFMPFFGDVKQELRGTHPGYSAKYFGNILGFDTLFEDDSTIGVALTFIKNIVNHKDSNKGDKSVIHTSVISLYGLKTLANNWFVQGVLSLGSSKIDNKEIRFTFPTISIASADYNSISTTTEITAGYTHSLSANTIITPLFGIEYTRLNKVDYTETGAGSQNLTVNRKEFNKAELIVGAKLDHSIAIEDFTFIPEVHGFVRYDAINKPLKITAALQGEPPSVLVPRTTVQTRVTYLVGAGFDIKKSNFEYGFGYDARIARKYIAHQGVFKLRLIF